MLTDGVIWLFTVGVEAAIAFVVLLFVPASVVDRWWELGHCMVSKDDHKVHTSKIAFVGSHKIYDKDCEECVAAIRWRNTFRHKVAMWRRGDTAREAFGRRETA